MNEQQKKELEAFISENRKREIFPKVLDRYREEKGMKSVDLYTKAGITKSYYYKLMNCTLNPNVSKVLVLAFGFALKLSRDEMDDLLLSAGFALSNYSRLDLAAVFCLERKIYDFGEISILLKEQDQKDIYIGKKLSEKTIDDTDYAEEITSAENLLNVLENLVSKVDGLSESFTFPDEEMENLDIENISDNELTKYLKTPILNSFDELSDILNTAKKEIEGSKI